MLYNKFYLATILLQNETSLMPVQMKKSSGLLSLLISTNQICEFRSSQSLCVLALLPINLYKPCCSVFWSPPYPVPSQKNSQSLISSLTTHLYKALFFSWLSLLSILFSSLSSCGKTNIAKTCQRNNFFGLFLLHAGGGTLNRGLVTPFKSYLMWSRVIVSAWTDNALRWLIIPKWECLRLTVDLSE